jgi:FkbM family methyltransferase
MTTARIRKCLHYPYLAAVLLRRQFLRALAHARKMLTAAAISLLPPEETLRQSANRLGVRIVAPYLGRYSMITGMDEDSLCLLRTGGYSEEEVRFAQRFISRDMVIADIGANIGYYAVAFADSIGAGPGHVHCFEPTPDIYRILCDNIRLGRFSNEIITTSQCALYDNCSTELRLYGYDARYNSVYNSIAPAVFERWGRQVRPCTSFLVKAVSLDHYCTTHRIDRFDLIKIDVEGAEIEVLNGATEVIKRSLMNPWFTMIVEINDDSQLAAHHSAGELLAKIKCLGLETGHYVGSTNTVECYQRAPGRHAPINIVCCRSMTAVNRLLEEKRSGHAQ